MLPVSVPLDPPQCFDSMHNAIDAAAHAALRVSTVYEVGGAIYSTDGRFCYTAPVTSKRIEEIDYKLALPKASILVALWHTHPTGAELSAEDKDLAKRLHVLMYVIAVQLHTVIGAERFTLDVPPVKLEYVSYNGVRYINRGTYLEAPDGKQFLRP